MKERHVCPKCHQATGWRGPSRLSKSKLRAMLFYIWHRSPCFVDCSNCGHTVSVKEWSNLKRIAEVMEEESLQERLERKEFYRDHVEPHLRRPRPQAIKQDIGKFMKHGRQAPWYRKSVKERKKPEED